MSERDYHNPSLQRIKDVVVSGDPELSPSFHEVLVYLWVVSEEGENPKELRNLPLEPEVLDNSLFFEPSRKLGGKNPLVALRTTIEGARRKGVSLEELSKKKEPLVETSQAPFLEERQITIIEERPTLGETVSTIIDMSSSINEASASSIPVGNAPSSSISPREELTESPSRRKKKITATASLGFASRIEIDEKVSHVPQKVMKAIFKAAEKERKGTSIFYKEEEILRAATRWKIENKRIPQKRTEKKITRGPKEWGSFNHLAELTGLSPGVLRAVLQDVPQQREKGRSPQYNIAEAVKKAKNPPPSADSKSGLYEDKQGNFWIPESRVKSRTKISRAEWEDWREDIAYQLVVAKNGKLIKFYDETQIKLRAEQQKLSLPSQQEKLVSDSPHLQVVFIAPSVEQSVPVQSQPEKTQQTGRLPRLEKMAVDNVVYISVGELRREGVTNSNHKTLYALFAELDGIEAQSRNGKPILLYPEAKARALLANREREEKAKIEKRAKRAKPNPEIYASRKDLATEYNLPISVVDRLLSSTDDPTWQNAPYYKKSIAKIKLSAYKKEHPDGSGIRVIKGKQYAPLLYFNNTYGIAYETLRKNFGSLTSLERDNVSLYPIDEGKDALKSLITAPQVNVKTGIYTDKANERWAPADVICQKLGISHDKLNTYLEDVPTKEIKDRHKVLVTGFNISEIEKNAADYLSLPTFTQFDGTENQLIDAQTLADDSGLSLSTVRDFLNPMLIKTRGKSPNGYPEKKAREQLNELLAKPEIDPKANQHVTEKGEIYVVRNEAGKRLGMTAPSLQRIIERGNVRSLEGRRGGAPHTLYNLSELAYYKENPLPRKPQPPRKKEVRDRRQELEQEARDIIASGFTLNTLDLKKNGYSGFAKRVLQHYPGGIVALRKRIEN